MDSFIEYQYQDTSQMSPCEGISWMQGINLGDLLTALPLRAQIRAQFLDVKVGWSYFLTGKLFDRLKNICV